MNTAFVLPKKFNSLTFKIMTEKIMTTTQGLKAKFQIGSVHGTMNYAISR